MVCPKCGDVVYVDAVFCARCGAMLAGTRPKEPDTPPAGPPNPWLKVAAGLFVVAAAVAILATLSLGRSGGASVRYVPDVVGMARADAEARLVKAGFECVIADERPSDTTEAGGVISQSPGPDVPTSRKRVAIALSLGSDVKHPEAARQPRQTAVTAKRSSTRASAGLVTTAKIEKAAQKPQAVSSRPKTRQAAVADSPAAPDTSSGPGYGSVAIEAEPDDWEVWVYIDDGPARGKCPITVRLPAGDHSVVLWEPSKQKRLAVPVTVEAGKTLSVRRNLGA